MNALLGRRAAGLREAMDDPDCDPRRLRATYAQFAHVNRWLAGWRGIFERWLRPRLRPGATLLDVGCGGGDVARCLAEWSARAGAQLDITAVDPDERALAFARALPAPPAVRFERATLDELLGRGRRFDFVVSNHVLHHMAEDGLRAFLEGSARLAVVASVHNDVRRSALAFASFAPLGLVVRGSFIVPDGLRSIRRAYRPAELRALAPQGWQVTRLEPFRTLLVYDGSSGEGRP